MIVTNQSNAWCQSHAKKQMAVMAAAGEDNILYDVFIRAEWSLEGEVLVGFILLLYNMSSASVE